jgi:hypothetical protein
MSLPKLILGLLAKEAYDIAKGVVRRARRGIRAKLSKAKPAPATGPPEMKRR